VRAAAVRADQARRLQRAIASLPDVLDDAVAA
jgi:hypothetical protein